MPPGRRPNYDARINDLLKQLRAALLGREQARVQANVEAQMAGLVAGLGRAGSGVVVAPAAAPVAPAAAAPVAKRRKGWSAAAKAKARARMVAYWKAKRGGAAKRGKAAKVEAAK